MNCFLNWFRLVTILNYIPQFGIMMNTLSRASHGVTGFMVIFFVVIMGFAQAYAIVFHARLRDFRTFGQVVFSLVRSLLGDFDYEALQDAHATMGPFLFLTFTALAVFVVLNMLIAIISEAYEGANEFGKGQQNVYLVHEIKVYLTDLFWHTIPGGTNLLLMLDGCFFKGKGGKVGCCGKVVLEKIHPGPPPEIEGVPPGQIEHRSAEQIRADAELKQVESHRRESMGLLKQLVTKVRQLEKDAVGRAGGNSVRVTDPTQVASPGTRGVYSQSPGGAGQGARPHDWLMGMRQEVMGVASALKTMQVSSTLMKQSHARDVEELKITQQQVVTELKASVVGLQQLSMNAVKKTVYCQQEMADLREVVSTLTEQHKMMMQNFVNVKCAPQPAQQMLTRVSAAGPQSMSNMDISNVTPGMSRNNLFPPSPAWRAMDESGAAGGLSMDDSSVMAANEDGVRVGDLPQAHRFLQAEKARVDLEKEELSRSFAEQKSGMAQLEKLQAEQAAERARLDEKDRMLNDQNSEQIMLHLSIVEREKQVTEQTQAMHRTRGEIEAQRQQTQSQLQEQQAMREERAAQAAVARRADAAAAVRSYTQPKVAETTQVEEPAVVKAATKEEREKELQLKLTAFYSRFNPSKLQSDKGGLFVAKAAQMYLDKQPALNQGLRAQYGYDLLTFEAAGNGQSSSPLKQPQEEIQALHAETVALPQADALPYFVKAIR
jgi:hypothetical protein